MSWPEVALRLALNVAIAAAIVFGLAAGVCAPLVLLGAGATAELAVRPYASNMADELLLGCGAIITVLILIGLCLNLTPWGLTRGTWAVAWLIVSGAVLAWRSVLGIGRIRLSVTRINSISLWVFAALLVFIAAGAIAMAGVHSWDQRPVLAFSLLSKSTSAVVVEVDATSTTGTYNIVATSDSPGAHHYFSPPVVVRANARGQALKRSVPINVSGRWTIYLDSVRGPSHLRELIVDVASN